MDPRGGEGPEAGFHVSVELTVVRGHAVGPGGAHDRDVLAQQRVSPLEGHADGVELLAHPTGAHTEDHPTPGDGIDGGQLLGQYDRWPVRRDEHPGAELDPVSHAGEDAHERDRVEVGVVRVERVGPVRCKRVRARRAWSV